MKFGSGIVALLLPWLAGPKAAKLLLLTGDDRVSAADMQAMGLVARVVPAAALLDEALALAARIAANDAQAVRLTKQAINRSLDIGGMRQALLAALEIDVCDRDPRNRGIPRVQRNPATRRRQGGHRLAGREDCMSKADKRVPEELAKFLEKYPDTQQLELLQPDMLGILRGKRVGRDEMAKPFAGGLNFCGATVLLDAKGMTFDRIDNGGRDGDPDVISTAVPGSLAPVPWAHVPTAQVLLAMDDSKGGPFFADPRQVLRHAMKPLQDMGLTAGVRDRARVLPDRGRRRSPDAARRPRSPARARSSRARSTAAWRTSRRPTRSWPTCSPPARRRTSRPAPTLKEFSPGQFEINLHHVANAELAADHGVLLKRAVKAVARKHGMAASFMAKPFAEWAGCGMHVHISLLDRDGRNIFAGTSKDGPFADTLRHAIGGLAKAMPESMAIFAPTAQFLPPLPRPASSCPLEPNWGTQPPRRRAAHPDVGAEDTRVEHRPGGADGNPYLVIAAILAGVHHGITNKVEPGPMVAQESIIDEKIVLPVRWSAALDAFEAGRLPAEVPRREVPPPVREVPSRGGRALPLGDQRPRLRVVPARGRPRSSASPVQRVTAVDGVMRTSADA